MKVTGYRINSKIFAKFSDKDEAIKALKAGESVDQIEMAESEQDFARNDGYLYYARHFKISPNSKPKSL